MGSTSSYGKVWYHPNMMNALEEILCRPDQLVRLLGACLGVNLVTVDVLVFNL